MLIALAQPVRAAVDTVIASVPPPPGELILNFPNEIPPSFDRVNLRFIGSVDSNGFSGRALITWKFDWILPSGDVAYSIPFTYGLDPGQTSEVNAGFVAGGCPSRVSLDFTTDSPFGANVNGTFTHTCTIPEPSGALLALASCCIFAARRSGVRRSPHPTRRCHVAV